MPPDSLVHNPVPTELDHGQVLAQHLADPYRRDEARREHQRQHQRQLHQQHAEECGGECSCVECVHGDPPVLIGVVIDEMFARRGIAAAQPSVDTPPAGVIEPPDQ